MRTLRGAGLALLLLGLCAGEAAAEVPGPVRVKGELTPVGLKGPIFVRVTFFVVSRDDYGFFKTPELVDHAYSYFDPSTRSQTLGFDVALDPVREYEVQIDVLDDAGNPRVDGTYYFIGPSFAQQYGQETAVLQGSTKNLHMDFGWTPRDPERANYVQVVPKAEDRYELVFYFNTPSGI